MIFGKLLQLQEVEHAGQHSILDTLQTSRGPLPRFRGTKLDFAHSIFHCLQAGFMSVLQDLHEDCDFGQPSDANSFSPLKLVLM